MKIDATRDVLVLDDGQAVHLEVVRMVLGDVLAGAAVLVQADPSGPGAYWYIARTATDEDGRPIVSKRSIHADRLLKRLDRVLSAWAHRKAPAQPAPHCTFPACRCRPAAAGAVVGAIECGPPPGLAAQESGLGAADEIAPPCPVCASSIRVGLPEYVAGTAVYGAVCSDPECDWRGNLALNLRTDHERTATARLQREEREAEVPDADLAPPDHEFERRGG